MATFFTFLDFAFMRVPYNPLIDILKKSSNPKLNTILMARNGTRKIF
jgi:hypothetical protein